LLEYKRTRFGTRLPEGILYTRSHYWLAEAPNEPGLWRVGFTKFALRMLGDLVEFQLEPAEKSETEIGARIGWIPPSATTSPCLKATPTAAAGSTPSTARPNRKPSMSTATSAFWMPQ
jgi:glycine cleavage system H protein